MQLSSRLDKLYSGKESFSDISDSITEELSQIEPLVMEDIPKSLNEKLKFSSEHMDGITAFVTLFEKVAVKLATVQKSTQNIARYSSFLDSAVPFRMQKMPASVLTKRDKLNGLRNLFTESLLNDDMSTARIIAAANGTFPELDNFRNFVQSFGTYISSVNLSIPIESNTQVDYLSSIGSIAPGDIMSIVTGANSTNLLEKQKSLIATICNYQTQYNPILTDHNTLCWSLSRSFIDLPIKLLDRAGLDPTKAVSSLALKVKSISNMTMDKRAKAGINLLTNWVTILYNSFLLIANLIALYAKIMIATYDCLWEFFFYQLHALEDKREVEILESALVMCRKSLPKEPLCHAQL